MAPAQDTEVVRKSHGHDTEEVVHDHGHDAHGHGHDHDEHGHGGHDDHAAHGHHAPPAPKYLVAPPARMGDISVRTWVAYSIFLLMVVLISALMLAGFKS
jgi:ABC-type Zn2+ transport system substrate-binding protein/surface adhesin